MAYNQALYTQARPDLANNWANAQANPNDPTAQWILQHGSFEQYAAQDFANNPQGEQQQATVQVTPQNAGNVTQSNLSNINNTPVTPAVTGSTNFGDLVANNQPSSAPALTAGTNINTSPLSQTPGGNYNQNQQGNQSGGFSTTGTTQNNQNQISTTQLASLLNSINQQNQTGGSNTTGTQNQTGTQTTGQAQSTQGTSTGTTTSKPVDTLGFGDLLKGQQGMVGQSDTARNAFLTDVMNTGGQQFGSQVDQAVRQSLSGPGMSGSGESARARAAGYSAAEIGRNNLNQRLAASSELAGPTGLSTLSGAANPYLGQTQTNNTNTGATATGGTTVNTANQTNNAQNSTNFSDLLSTSQQSQNQSQINKGASTNVTQDSTQGNAVGSSNQSASGQIPQSNSVQTGGGGCIICTAGIHHGLWRNKRVLRRVVKHKLQTNWHGFRSAALGYFHLFTPIAKACLRSRKLSRLSMPIAKSVVYEELRISGRGLPFRVLPWVLHWTWHGICSVAGDLLRVAPALKDKEITEVAMKNQVYFNTP